MHPHLKLLALNKGRGHFRVEAAADADSATIYLYDAIVASAEEAEWWGGIDPLTVINQLAGISASTIHLRVNSPGGSVFAARAIEQALREHPARVVAHVDGYAASAASFIIMAADDIVMAPGAMLMIHKAWTIAFGNSKDLVDQAALLDKIDGTLAETYARRIGDGASINQISDWMAAETWFTAQEAVDAGLADRIADDDAGTKARATARAWDLSAYRNAPASASAAPAAPAAPTPSPAAAPQPFDLAAALRHIEVVSRI